MKEDRLTGRGSSQRVRRKTSTVFFWKPRGKEFANKEGVAVRSSAAKIESKEKHGKGSWDLSDLL